MKKIIKKYGCSLVVVLNSEDKNIYNLKECDVVEVIIDKKRMKGGDK